MKGEIYLTIYDTAATTTYTPVLLDAVGRKFSEDIIEISRKDRTANGRLVIDIINTKKKFTLAYETIDGASITEFENYYNLQSQLQLTIYSSDIAYDEYIVIMSPYNKTRWILTGNGLWTGVSFEFEEV